MSQKREYVPAQNVNTAGGNTNAEFPPKGYEPHTPDTYEGFTHAEHHRPM